MAELSERAGDLVVIIEADAVSATELSTLLAACDGSFSHFARRRLGRGSKPRLLVRAVRPGSIGIILEAIDGAQKVLAAKEYLAPWATHIFDLLQSIAMGLPPNLAREDKKLVEAISSPVANGSATQINVVHNGDIVIHVGPSEAAAVIQAVRPFNVPMMSEVVPEAQRPLQLMDADQIGRLQRGQLFGTAFDVAGSWYARLDGLRGVLVPIHAAGALAATLIHGQAYSFAGTPERGGRGETIAITLTDAVPVGRSTA